MNSYLRHLLEAARQAARDAAVAILEIYATPFDVRNKTDASPVTEADERAERIIIAALTKVAPDIPVIAEEMMSAGAMPAKAPRFWLVDPLDGTREFVAKNGEFCVSIGLVEGDRAILGVIHAPIKNVTYAACGAGTATRQDGDTVPVAIEARNVPLSNPIVASSRSHGNNTKLTDYFATLDKPQTRISGSAVKFCFLAEGSADLYPRFGPTMEWDTAAGQAILEAAGGSVTQWNGEPLRYGKPGFRNVEFLARGKS
jgi:3'(2'), 5'-bisphosphate nucleotidase